MRWKRKLFPLNSGAFPLIFRSSTCIGNGKGEGESEDKKGNFLLSGERRGEKKRRKRKRGGRERKIDEGCVREKKLLPFTPAKTVQERGKGRRMLFPLWTGERKCLSDSVVPEILLHIELEYRGWQRLFFLFAAIYQEGIEIGFRLEVPDMEGSVFEISSEEKSPASIRVPGDIEIIFHGFRDGTDMEDSISAVISRSRFLDTQDFRLRQRLVRPGFELNDGIGFLEPPGRRRHAEIGSLGGAGSHGLSRGIFCEHVPDEDGLRLKLFQGIDMDELLPPFDDHFFNAERVIDPFISAVGRPGSRSVKAEGIPGCVSGERNLEETPAFKIE